MKQERSVFQKSTFKKTTLNSKRYVPLPDFIMDELYLAKARYEETLKNDPEFDENLRHMEFQINCMLIQEHLIKIGNWT